MEPFRPLASPAPSPALCWEYNWETFVRSNIDTHTCVFVFAGSAGQTCFHSNPRARFLYYRRLCLWHIECCRRLGSSLFLNLINSRLSLSLSPSLSLSLSLHFPRPFLPPRTYTQKGRIQFVTSSKKVRIGELEKSTATGGWKQLFHLLSLLFLPSSLSLLPLPSILTSLSLSLRPWLNFFLALVAAQPSWLSFGDTLTPPRTQSSVDLRNDRSGRRREERERERERER